MGSQASLVHAVNMQGHIIQIITSASGFLPSLFALGVAAVVAVPLTTGLGARLAIWLEDLHYRRRVAPADSRVSTG